VALFKRLHKQDAEFSDHRLKIERPRTHAASHDESNWLVSYADMMTLLCGFFIMLFSMSTLNAPQYEKVKEEISKHFGGKFEGATGKLTQALTAILTEAGVSKDAKVEVDQEGVAVIFESHVFFDTMNAYLTEEGRAALTHITSGLMKIQNDHGHRFRISVEGHTDSRPILSGIYATNWELSGARSARVVRFLSEAGFQSDQLSAVAFGETRPKVANRLPSGEWNESALSHNRRVVLRISDMTPLTDTPQQAEESAVSSH